MNSQYNLDQQLQQTIEFLFQKYDRDRSGQLNMNELPGFMNEAFQYLGIQRQLSMMDIQSMMRNVDNNCDYQANRQELFMALKRFLNTNYSGFQGNPNFQPFNQGSFNQGGFNQGGFNQGGFNQGGFNQGGFNQGGFNQGGFNQGGFNQGGFGQGGFNQGGFGQGGFGHQQGHGRRGRRWEGVNFGSPAEQQARALIDNVYARADTDGSGCLNLQEFAQALNQVSMQSAGRQMSYDQAMMLIQRVDRNCDGQIDRPEFFACLQMILNGQV